MSAMGVPAGARRRIGASQPRPGEEPEGEATGTAILRATEKLLADRGLDELTVVDIITAAGVSRATFYLYFESKHAAVAALANHVVEDIYRHGFAPWMATAEPLTEQLVRDLWRRTIAGWREHRPVLLAAAQGWRTHGGTFEGWGESFRRYVGQVRDYVVAARAAGNVPPGMDADGLAASLVWMSENMMYLSLTGEAPEFVDDEQLATTITGVWLRAIYGQPPAPTN